MYRHLLIHPVYPPSTHSFLPLSYSVSNCLPYASFSRFSGAGFRAPAERGKDADKLVAHVLVHGRVRVNRCKPLKLSQGVKVPMAAGLMVVVVVVWW